MAPIAPACQSRGMRLGPELLGQRVSMRFRDGGPETTEGPALRDVVGRVLEIDGTRLRVERRDGTTTLVPVADVVLCRVVPIRPLRSPPAARATADDLTRISSRGWPAPVSVPLGDWELRAGGGFTGRANSVAVTGSPRLPFADAERRVQAFYADHQLPARAQVIDGSEAEGWFTDAGWAPMAGRYAGAVVCVADLAASYPVDPMVALTGDLDDGWLDRYGRLASGERHLARAVLTGPHTVGFARIGEPPVGIGRVVVTGEWAGLAAVEVDPDRRRAGLARRIVSTLLAWAVERGATRAYLQTTAKNTAALRLYEGFGFGRHHTYHYLEPRASRALSSQRRP